MASSRPNRAVHPDPPEAGANDLPLDHALSLLLADETENALRWGAAVLESGPWTPSALVVTARLLDQMGRKRAAIEGLNLAVQQATAEGNLPLAMAALGDLRTLGGDVSEPLDRVASAFCEGSDRLRDTQTESLLPQLGEFRPLSPFLTGPALASKAAQIVETVRRTEKNVAPEEPSRIAPLPLFSSLRKESLHALLSAFETVTVPAGHAVIREGEEEAAAYIVARGELEVSRRSNDGSGKPVVLARLGSGAFFGEMAILSQLPGAASVTATRPSILLVARREALESVVEQHPDVAVELAAHCRRQSVANLGWASPVVVAIPARDRAMLVERFETRMFEAGDKLVESGETAQGLHLIVSGEIAVVAYEAGERVVLAHLTAGETVGEVELVLCRNASADAIAVRPTATLFLQREEFFALVQDHPAILHGLYGIAVRRHAETSLALEAGSAAVGDESLLGEVPDNIAALVEGPSPSATVEAPSARIQPLARGTLGLPRRSSAPPAAPPPAVTQPTPASAKPAVRATLPPPPMPPPPSPSGMPSSQRAPSSQRTPSSQRAPSLQPSSQRTPSRNSLPPPIPPSSIAPSAPLNSTLPGVGSRLSSFAPVSTTGEWATKSIPPTQSSKMLGRVVLVAVAASVVAFVSVSGLRGVTVTSNPVTTGPAVAAVPPAQPAALPAPSPTAVEPAPPRAAAPAANEAPKDVAPSPVTPVTSVKPAPEAARPKTFAAVPAAKVRTPSAPRAAAAQAAIAPAPGPAASAADPATFGAPRPSFSASKPAAPDPSLTAGEFGGRE